MNYPINGTAEEKKKAMLKILPSYQYDFIFLRKLTSWGFWNGGEYVCINAEIGAKVYIKLRKEIRESFNSDFVDELAELLKLKD